MQQCSISATISTVGYKLDHWVIVAILLLLVTLALTLTLLALTLGLMELLTARFSPVGQSVMQTCFYS